MHICIYMYSLKDINSVVIEQYRMDYMEPFPVVFLNEIFPRRSLIVLL